MQQTKRHPITGATYPVNHPLFDAAPALPGAAGQSDTRPRRESLQNAEPPAPCPQGFMEQCVYAGACKGVCYYGQ